MNKAHGTVTEWETYEGVTYGYNEAGDRILEISARVRPNAWNGHTDSNMRGWAVWDENRKMTAGKADGLRASKKAALAAL